MSYKIITIPSFDKELKSLSKKHRSIKIDLAQLGKQLLENPKIGNEILQTAIKLEWRLLPKEKAKVAALE
jgi:mRNA-degrading endonuclease RelE of RelBE toxin-antitoxin system